MTGRIKTKKRGVTELPSRRLNPETVHTIGWTAIALAVVVVFQHLLSHMGFFTVSTNYPGQHWSRGLGESSG